MTDVDRADRADPQGVLAEVRRTGFLTVPLLEADQVADLTASYHRLTDENGFGCRPSIVSPDPIYRNAAIDVVQAVLEPAVARMLPDFRCVLAAYVPKEPGPNSAMEMHQDWSTCDETACTPVGVWVALTETGPADGPLALIPGSHRHAPPARGSGMPMVLGEVGDWRSQTPVELPVPVGTAIIFHPGIIHGSGPNQGSRLRLSVVSRFQPRGVATLHFSQIEDRVVTYAVEPAFYASNYAPGDPAPGPVLAAGDPRIPATTTDRTP